MSIDLVIAVYLYSVCPFVNKRYFHDLVLLLEAMRAFLNGHFRGILQRHSEHISTRLKARCLVEPESHQICEVENAEYLPLAMEEFINDYSPRLSKFGRAVAKGSLLDFCKWLYEKRLTNIQLSLDD
jgi:hypothetical protein